MSPHLIHHNPCTCWFKVEVGSNNTPQDGLTLRWYRPNFMVSAVGCHGGSCRDICVAIRAFATNIVER